MLGNIETKREFHFHTLLTHKKIEHVQAENF